MKSALPSSLRLLSDVFKFGGRRSIISQKGGYSSLDQVELYLSPYDRKVKQVNGAYGFFNGLIHCCNEDVRDRCNTVSILFAQDLLRRIPDLISELTESFLRTQHQSVNWNEFSNQICRRLYAEFYGIPVTKETSQACMTVFDWLFDASRMDFQQLPEKQQLGIAASLTMLRKTIEQSVVDAKIPTDLAPATVVARSLALQHKFALTDDSMIDLLMGVLVGTYPVLAVGFEKLIHPLTSEKKFQSNICQAASVDDIHSIESFVEQLPEIRNIYIARVIPRLVADTHTVATAFHSKSQLKKNDIINFWLDTEKIKSDGFPRSIAFNREDPAKNYLLFGAEPHISFGKPIAIKVLSAVLAQLFSTYRIRDYHQNELQLEHLPLNPKAYQFRILGSSPPWAVGEEQAWLLDSSGFKQHVQYNILSLKGYFQLRYLQSNTFFKSTIFYSCYDRTHNVVMGSPYSGAGQATLAMGEMMHRFFCNAQREALKPAIQFSESEHFKAVFDAYSIIRNNYFTWAYFTSFLDKGYKFLFEALILFRKKDGFKPLSIAGDALLFIFIGLVAVSLELPIVRGKLREYFESTIAANLAAMRSAISTLDNILSDGRPYIFGEEFTAADIHICANMGNLIAPNEYHGGGKLPALDRYPPTYKGNVEEFRQTLTGQYVLRVYRQHRI